MYLAEMSWMIKFFAKKSSLNESKRNLWKEDHQTIYEILLEEKRRKDISKYDSLSNEKR